MLHEVESDHQPTTRDKEEQLDASWDNLSAEGTGTASSAKGGIKSGRNSSRASFSSRYRMSDGDSKSLFSYKPSAFETAVDACYKTVIVPELDGKPLEAWLLTEIDHWNFEKERIVLLTDNSLLIIKYDFIKLAVCDTKRIFLSSIHKIQIGDLTFPQRSLMQSRDCGGVRLHFGEERAPSLRHRWNPWSKVIPYCTFVHHPLIYNKNERDTLIYNIDHMTETVKNGIERDLKRNGLKKELTVDEGPILIESYAGLSSALFNQSHVGFSKQRGHIYKAPLQENSSEALPTQASNRTGEQDRFQTLAKQRKRKAEKFEA